MLKMLCGKKKVLFRGLLYVTVISIVVSACLIGVLPVQLVVHATDYSKFIDEKPADKCTSIGLTAWVIEAYKEKWGYIYGASNPEGKVSDCSGMIWSYKYAGKDRTGFTSAAEEVNAKNVVYKNTGFLPEDMPRVHGLGLYWGGGGHVGLYLGSNVSINNVTGVVIDNNSSGGVTLSPDSSLKNWVRYIYLSGVEYPRNCFVELEGTVFYYGADGQYAVAEEEGEWQEIKDIKVKKAGETQERLVAYKDSYGNTSIHVNSRGAVREKIPDSLLYMKASSKTKSSTVLILEKGAIGTNSVSADVSVEEMAESANEGDVVGDGEGVESIVTEVSKDKIERPLTFDEMLSVDNINKRHENESYRGMWSMIFTMFSFVGILVLAYTLLLLLAFYFDLFNTMTDISVLHKLTFHSVYPLSNLDDSKFITEVGERTKFISHKGIWSIFVCGVLASAVLLNAKVFMLSIIRLWNWLEYLIHNLL